MTIRTPRQLKQDYWRLLVKERSLQSSRRQDGYQLATLEKKDASKEDSQENLFVLQDGYDFFLKNINGDVTGMYCQTPHIRRKPMQLSPTVRNEYMLS